MLQLKKLAELARVRASARLSGKTKGEESRMLTAINQLFHERLLESCQRVADHPGAVTPAYFIALPERLMSKIAYLSIGQTRSERKTDNPSESLDPDVAGALNEWLKVGEDTEFRALDSTTTVQRLKKVLLCHGLSPIGDSVLLLADIGRAHRLSRVTALPINVMLAGSSWMSSNRSLRQFTSLTEKEIDVGLRVCVDKRIKLYEALNIQSVVREIAPYDRANEISRKKLRQIAQKYASLASALWGLDSYSLLDSQAQKVIGGKLDQLPFRAVENMPPHIAAFAQFPGTLAALEAELLPHLEILRTVGREFSSFEEHVFTYFFAQYYAQAGYRGHAVKIAPLSETKFDRPFDDLDAYFKAWGEGHSATEPTVQVRAGRGELQKAAKHPLAAQKLSAVYLPQYQVGKLRLLPYSPLSLDALRSTDGSHQAIMNSIISLEGDLLTVEGLWAILAETPLVQRNRLLADTWSFIQLCAFNWGLAGLVQACRTAGLSNVDALIEMWPPLFQKSFGIEQEIRDHTQLADTWYSWLKSAELDDDLTHVPVHIYPLMLDESDWRAPALQHAAALTLNVAIAAFHTAV